MKWGIYMNKHILQQYTVIVDFLGKTLGPDYEVVLQDLDPKHQAIVAIANGHVSGRTVGSPLTNTALHLLSSKIYEAHDFLCNYKGVAANGHVLRSSTMMIKDENNEPVGFLCINYDDSRFMELHQKLLSTIHPDSFLEQAPIDQQPASAAAEQTAAMPMTESFPTDITLLMQKIFDDVTKDLATPITRLNQFERKDIVQKLNDQGLFQLKGAISFVARQFSCSTATVYRYLSEING